MVTNLSDRVKFKVRELLLQKNVTIYTLAEKADLTEACIRNWYTKRNYTPSLEAIEKIAKAFEVPVTELVLEENQENIAVTNEEKELLEKYLKLNKKQKNAIKVQIDAFLDN